MQPYYEYLKEPSYNIFLPYCQKLLLKIKGDLNSVEEQIDSKLVLMTTRSSTNAPESRSISVHESPSLELPSTSTSTPARKRSISAMKNSPDQQYNISILCTLGISKSIQYIVIIYAEILGIFIIFRS